MRVTRNGDDRLVECCRAADADVIRVQLGGALWLYRYCAHHRAAIVSAACRDLTRWGAPPKVAPNQLKML